MKSAVPRMNEQQVARRLAQEFEDGMIVNLGGGLPTLACDLVPEGREVLFHSENGVLAYGRTATPQEATWNLVNAGLQSVRPVPGMSFFAHDESFAMIRGRHIDICALGGLQVSEQGDLANWAMGHLDWCGGDIHSWIREGRFPPGIGGAMDLALGAKRIIVAMTHSTKDGKPKVVTRCTYELTAARCVSTIITDLAFMEVTAGGLLLKETAPGVTPEQVQGLTEPVLLIDPNVQEMNV